MWCHARGMLWWVLGAGVMAGAASGAAQEWVGPMRQVHARFRGTAGTFAQFGDSITVTMAFWAPLRDARHNAPPEMVRAFDKVNRYMRPECWRQWKGAEYGSEGGTTVRWAQQHLDQWLNRLRPEVALVMFGTNDLHSLSLDEYRRGLQNVVQRCLDRATVVILSTIPPRHGFEKKAADFAEAARQIARQLRVPLVDYHAEILRRRPDDWDGASPSFAAYEGYDVPTLICRDGVHPSHPRKFQNDYSEEALRSCGYSLRNYLVLLAYAEVIEKVLQPEAEEKR